MVSAGFDGTVATDYPERLDYGTSEGRATQTLTLGAPRHLGVEGGIGLFPSTHVGVQLVLGYVTRDLSGTSSPYAASIDYTGMLPPDYVPREYHSEFTRAWPDPTGEATVLTVSANGALRWDAKRRVSGTVSGGLTVFRSKGFGESLAYNAVLARRPLRPVLVGARDGVHIRARDVDRLQRGRQPRREHRGTT